MVFSLWRSCALSDCIIYPSFQPRFADKFLSVVPRSILPPVGIGHFRLVPAPVPANFVNFRSVPAGSGRILATGSRHVPYRRRSGEIPTESVSEVVGTSPAKTVPESGPMETVGARRIRPSLIGTGRNYPTDTGSESVCKEPVGYGRFRPSRNDLGSIKTQTTVYGSKR